MLISTKLNLLYFISGYQQTRIIKGSTASDWLQSPDAEVLHRISWTTGICQHIAQLSRILNLHSNHLHFTYIMNCRTAFFCKTLWENVLTLYRPMQSRIFLNLQEHSTFNNVCKWHHITSDNNYNHGWVGRLKLC